MLGSLDASTETVPSAVENHIAQSRGGVPSSCAWWPLKLGAFAMTASLIGMNPESCKGSTGRSEGIVA